MKPCFIFDFDNTLANGDHRLHHIHKTPKDWTAYFAECGADEPIRHVIEILRSLSADFDIFICSGRSDEVRAETMKWLRHHVGMEFVMEDVLMRKAGDHRADDLLKLEMLATIRARGYEPLMAFDDRTRVVNSWRAAGIPCAQVAPGDF